MEKEHRVRISAHHGDIERPNQLKAARRVLKRHPEIDCLEIDFVSFREQIVSSHDYELSVIELGAPLQDWLRLCAERRLVLWIDVKQNEWFYFNAMYGQFDVGLFFDILKETRREVLRSHAVDLRDWVWIGCQDCALRDALHRRNQHAKHRWQLVLDLPFIKSYVYKALLPSCMPGTLMRLAEEEVLNSEYRHFPIISLDKDFFPTHDDLVEFVRALWLSKGTTVILNSFSRDVAPIRIKGLHIVMQYDYTTS